MQHFVITRFNIASPGREVAIRNTPGWLGRRFDLFEAYCLPSMAAQLPGHFKWLIYFDEKTPDTFRARIEQARKQVAFEPIFVGPSRMSRVVSDVKARLETNQGRLVTTRLDNDDAVSRDFLERIRGEAKALPDRTIINFREGIALNNGRLFAAADPSNPFASLVERAADAETIWAVSHTELGTRFPIRQIITEPCWLQVVHGENVSNRIKSRRLADKDIAARFALSPEVTIHATSSGALLLDRMLIYPMRTLREMAIRRAKMILRR